MFHSRYTRFYELNINRCMRAKAVFFSMPENRREKILHSFNIHPVFSTHNEPIKHAAIKAQYSAVMALMKWSERSEEFVVKVERERL